MKHARKLTSLLLALVMVFALAVTVAAEGGTGTTGTGSITVDNPIEGQNYTAYKIFDVVYDGAKKNYSYTIKDTSEWYQTVSGYTTGLTLTKVGDTTSNTYVVTTTDAFSPAAFADALKKALDADSTAFNGTSLTRNGTQATATVNELGYYFVTSTNGALCNLTTTNPHITIHDKNDMPFEKTAPETSVEVGQTVNYTIKGKVPDYTGFKTYTYLITDTMSKGLTFKKDVKVTVDGTDVTTACTPTYDVEKNANKFTVSIPVKSYPIGKEILVTYSAVVNENAVAVVSTNEAKLTYSNNPTTGETKDSQPQKKEVYSAKIVIDKFETGKQDTVKLEGAEFVLYKEETIENTKTTRYYKWNDTDKKVEWVTTQADATTVKTDNKGAASFKGLADGTYQLVETKAPAGYNQLTGPQEVKVAGSTTDTTKLSVEAKVANSAGTLLPSTGGMGTTIFYVLGAVLVVGAGVLLVTKKRMSQSEI